LAWLVPLFVLWSNLHGGVLGGFGTLGLAAAGWTITWAALRRPARWSSAFRLSRDLSRHTLKRELQRPAPIRSLRDATNLWLCVAGCGLALLATPYGTASLEAWLTIMSMSLPDLIIEHAPLDPRTPPGILAILLFVIYAGVFAATPRGWWRVTFWLPVVWFVLTCLRIRHAPLFAMLAGIALADLVPQSRLAAWLVRRGWLRGGTECQVSGVRCQSAATPLLAYPTTPLLYCPTTVAAVLIMLVPLLGAAVWTKHVGPLPLVGAGWARPTPRVWPAGVLSAVREFEADHPDATPIFNEPVLGGFLIYNCPRLRVFIDGRCELYGEPFLRDCVAAWRNPERVGQWERQFGFSAALVEAGSPLERYFKPHPSWREKKRSASAVFYVRVEEKRRSGAVEQRRSGVVE
jgi:hypothetical protein